jgi:hypothetical protein
MYFLSDNGINWVRHHGKSLNEILKHWYVMRISYLRPLTVWVKTEDGPAKQYSINCEVEINEA